MSKVYLLQQMMDNLGFKNTLNNTLFNVEGGEHEEQISEAFYRNSVDLDQVMCVKGNVCFLFE